MYDGMQQKMKIKEITGSGNGGKKDLALGNGNPYFSIRIRMIDKESYDRVVWYLKETAIKKEESDYIFDNEEKQIARTIPSKRTIELTKDVKEEIRSKIERIIAGY